MYKINDSVLMSRVDILDTFREGEEYFKNDRVKEVKTNSDYTYFEGKVHNSTEHLTKIRFKEDGQIKTTICDCADYKRNLGDCNHIMALFHFIREFERKNLLKEKREKELRNMIADYSSSEERDRLFLETEYNLEIEKEDEEEILSGANLNFRIGESRLYLVRNIDSFFTHKDNEELKFGKFFTYDPRIHFFRREDKAVVEFINRVYENALSYIPEDNNRILEDKNLFLKPLVLKEFLELVEGRELNITFNDKDYKEVEIIEKELPLKMDIEDRDGNLVIKLYSDKNLEFLTPDGKYIFAEGEIYKLSDEERDKVVPIYEQIVFKGGGEVVIPNEYREGYISNVLRNISPYIELNFSPKVKKLIYEPELEVEIYFDNLQGSITGKINFIYDDIEINPFSSNSDTKLKKDKILLRNSEREMKILSILEEGYFRVIDGGIYLDEDDEIYNLVANIIPRLQEYSNVYYSDNFKDIRVNKSKIVSNLSLNDELDVLEFNFSLDGINIDEIESIFKAVRQDKRYFRLKDGSFLPLKDDFFKNIKSIVDEFQMTVKDDKITMPKYMSLYLDEYIDKDKLEGLVVDNRFTKLIDDIKNSKHLDYEVPEAMKGILRSYQKRGFSWLKTMSRYGLGGILADDMGLGKTIQVIAFLLSEKEERGKHPSLVVVPTSLVYNWENEINKFANGELKSIIINGPKEERLEYGKKLMDYDVVITSYPLLRNDMDIYEDIKFRYCILDEAQNIKNSESLNARSSKIINAENNFALTGTPMENSISELWSIFDFLMPGYLLTKRQFTETYEKPIFKDKDEDSLKTLNRKIQPFILRRLKKDVLKELPDKIEQTVLVDMTKEQKEVYLYYIKSLKEEIEHEIQTKGYSRSHIKILTALTRLRQICSDPSLFIEDYDGGSGKLESLKVILEDSVASGHRILIFSQFTSMLDIIEKELKKEKVKYMYLSGSTPMEERTDMVDDFNNGYGDIFLISLKAGGSGLNLVGADTVIHFDPWWNPAVEDQATDRAYRIGQENIVQVIKLITKGTIEEKIFDLQEHKKEMIDMVIHEGETLISKLEEDEILSLFEL